MPTRRSPASTSLTIWRYRGSKMCSGRKTFGKRTTLGSGKSGRSSDIADCRLQIDWRLQIQSALCNLKSAISASVNCLRLLVHVVHEHVLSERVRRREVRLALADLGDAADEAHQIVVAGEHERIDHDPAPAARRDLRARFGDNERIEAERVLV